LQLVAKKYIISPLRSVFLASHIAKQLQVGGKLSFWVLYATALPIFLYFRTDLANIGSAKGYYRGLFSTRYFGVFVGHDVSWLSH